MSDPDKQMGVGTASSMDQTHGTPPLSTTSFKRILYQKSNKFKELCLPLLNYSHQIVHVFKKLLFKHLPRKDLFICKLGINLTLRNVYFTKFEFLCLI